MGMARIGVLGGSVVLAAGMVARAGEIGKAHPEQGMMPISAIDGMEQLPARWAAFADVAEVPGFAVAVIRNGELVGLEAFGDRDPEGNPATVDTMYYIASITKVLTGEAVCGLADQGKIDLDGRVMGSLHELDLPDDEVEQKVTVRDLLTHRYGIEAGGVVMLEAYTGEVTRERFFNGLKVGNVVGSVKYTNTHFTMLGWLIEKITGQRWQDYLDSALFDKVGMTRTTAYASEMYGDDDAAIPMAATGKGVFVRSDVIKTDRMMHAAGGVGMSVRDGATWLMTVLNGGEAPNGERVLGSELQREMFDLAVPYEETDGSIRAMDGRGLAWEVGHWRDTGKRYAHHGGGFVGCATMICVLPDDRDGVVVFTNVGMSGSLFTTMVSIDVIDALLGRETDDDLYAAYIGGLIPRNLDRLYGAGRIELPPRESISHALPLAQRAYEGLFTSDQWGEIELSVRGGRLHVRRGDLHAEVARVEDDGGTIIAVNHNGEVPIRVVVARGAVTALEFEIEDEQWARYEREE